MAYGDGHVFVTNKELFPNKDHWAIITFGQHRGSYDGVDGQIDSYPGIEYYMAYDNEKAWKDEIISMTESNNKRFVAFKASKPVSTKTTVVVEIEK